MFPDSTFYQQYKDHYVIFVKSSFFIKSYLRDVIYDLNRSDYRFIPSDMILPEQWNGRKISELVSSIDPAVLEFLFREEHIFLTPHKQDVKRFTAIDIHFEAAYHFVSAILMLDRNEFCSTPFIGLLQKLCDLGVKHLAFYARCPVYTDGIVQLMKWIETMDFVTVEFIIPYQETIEEETFAGIFQNNPRIRKITCYGAGEVRKLYDNWPIYHIDLDLQEGLPSSISPDQMCPDMEVFKESHFYNVFYNGKLIVDMEGNLYESVYFDKIYGNLFRKKKTEVMRNKRYASVKKDMIDVCRICEFRHMCIDSELPVQRADGTYFRKRECNYNPFIAKWIEEEGYSSLEECGIICNDQTFQIDEHLLNQKFHQLYE